MVYSIHDVSFLVVHSRTTLRKSSCDTFFLANDNRVSRNKFSQEHFIIVLRYTLHTHTKTLNEHFSHF